MATTLQALATPSRLLILSRLREGPCAATELATEECIKPPCGFRLFGRAT
ncbi:hypothetical protein [Streptomyces sp. NRRL S-1022]|nr:hypothetical protein [Streptomyces sp. NRRL S-1022]